MLLRPLTQFVFFFCYTQRSGISNEACILILIAIVSVRTAVKAPCTRKRHAVNYPTHRTFMQTALAGVQTPLAQVDTP